MIDTIRHFDVFRPTDFLDQRIDIIGAGATGSRIALSLAKLGITNIHIWDFDNVEAHNIANQAYGNADIGKPKVEALKELIFTQTGIEVTTHNERVDGSQRLGDVVFILTDTMSSRKEIWEKALRYKPYVKFVVETRMGKNAGRIYAVNPSAPTEVEGWEASLYEDGVAEVSACGATISIGPTAEIVSGFAVWQFLRWHQTNLQLAAGTEPTDLPENELIFSLQPMGILSSSFG